MAFDPADQVAAISALFDKVSADYDNVGVSFFGPIADGLVRALDPQPGERCADLGCGRGAVTGRLADAVLPDGRVTGLDVSPGMLAQAEDALGDRPGVELVAGDASDPELPAAAYDVVASSLVLFFLPEPWEALRRWVGLLAPGGRIGLTTFGEFGPGWRALDALVRPWMPPLDPRTVGPDSPFASDAGMEQALSRAGAVEVTTTTNRIDLRFDSVEQWIRFSRAVGQRAAWDRMTPAESEQVAAQATEVFDGGEFGEDAFWQVVRYTLGRAV